MLGVTACSDDAKHVLFTPKPECKGDAVVPYMGTNPQVISQLAIGSAGDGFDLDGDGKPDNKLGGVSSLAQSAIDDSFKNFSIVIPIEMFDMPAVAMDGCVKFAVYLGAVTLDDDGDGKKTSTAGGDCNDHDPRHPPGRDRGHRQHEGRRLRRQGGREPREHSPSTDTVDHDGDGYSMAQGDCDDTNPAVHPGAIEICGDGLDNDCDGVADRTNDGSATRPRARRTSTTSDVVLDKLSFDSSGAPQISFVNGSIDKNLKLAAGPSIFSVNIPVQNILTLDLAITGATIHRRCPARRLDHECQARRHHFRSNRGSDPRPRRDADRPDAEPVAARRDVREHPRRPARAAEVQEHRRAEEVRRLQDARHRRRRRRPRSVLPFGSSTTLTKKVADVCIDGDGTEVHSTYDAMGNIIDHCAQALDSHGKPRFVDGISVELNFATTRIHSIKPPVTP